MYDRIHVGACCPKANLPDLYNLLAPGGVLVTPFMDKLIRVVKDMQNNITTNETLAHVRYGDLVVPSEAELAQAVFAAEKYRAMLVKVPDDTFFADFADMINKPKYADVIIKIEGVDQVAKSQNQPKRNKTDSQDTITFSQGEKTVYAHTLMLALRCPFLHDLAIRSQAQNLQLGEICITNIPYEVFMEVLKYIYCGKVSLKASQMVYHVQQAAVDLKMEGLEKACGDYLADSQSKANEPIDLIANNLGGFVNNQRFSDVAFVVEGEKVYAHKLILAIRSTYFRSILMTGMKESAQSEITLPEVRRDSFIALLRFLYTADDSIVDEENVVDVLETANYFSAERLKCVCELLLKKAVDVESVPYILQVAIRFEAFQLRRVCMEVMLQNFDAVSQTKAFQDLDRELLVSFTSEACRRLQLASGSVRPAASSSSSPTA